jgi:hypothetical protein
MKPKVTALFLNYEIDTPRRYKYIRWGGEFQRSRYLNLMKKSEPFMKVITSLLERLKDERDIICISERIKLIDELYLKVHAESKSKFCGTGGLETLQSKMTFATPGKCRDGIDAPWKDCVIMTSPISNIEQLAGRVLRTNPEKKTPTVIDMVDYGCQEIAKTFLFRNKFYKEKDWDIQYVFISNGKMRVLPENEALELIRKEPQ